MKHLWGQPTAVIPKRAADLTPLPDKLFRKSEHFYSPADESSELGIRKPNSFCVNEGSFEKPELEVHSFQIPDPQPSWEMSSVCALSQCLVCYDRPADAVMMPCCAVNVCESCAKDALTTGDKKCPLKDCPAPDEAQVDDLIPNRSFRTKAATFR